MITVLAFEPIVVELGVGEADRQYVPSVRAGVLRERGRERRVEADERLELLVVTVGHARRSRGHGDAVDRGGGRDAEILERVLRRLREPFDRGEEAERRFVERRAAKERQVRREEVERLDRERLTPVGQTHRGEAALRKDRLRGEGSGLSCEPHHHHERPPPPTRTRHRESSPDPRWATSAPK